MCAERVDGSLEVEFQTARLYEVCDERPAFVISTLDEWNRLSDAGGHFGHARLAGRLRLLRGNPQTRWGEAPLPEHAPRARAT